MNKLLAFAAVSLLALTMGCAPDDGGGDAPVAPPTALTHLAQIADTADTALYRANDIDIVGDYAYVTAGTETGLEVIDISDPASPTHVGAIFDDETTLFGGNWTDKVVVSGNYAYVTGRGEGFTVIDVSTPSNPTHVSSTALVGAKGVDIAGDTLYVTVYTDGGSVEIYNVQDRSNPQWLGSISGFLKPSDIVVVGNYAYVSSFIGTADGTFDILNISVPAYPTLAGTFTPDPALAFAPYNFAVNGSNAFIASWNGSIVVVDISAPESPSFVSAFDDTVDTALGKPQAIVVDGDYAYIASREVEGGETAGVAILDISIPSAMSHVLSVFDDATIAVLNPRGFAKKGDNVYITSMTDNGVQVLSID